MQVADQLGQALVGGNQRRRELIGVAGGVADALDAGDVGHVLQQGGKVSGLGCASHAGAISVDVLPQQRDLLHPLVGQPGHLDQNIFKRARHFFAPGIRHHAVTAVLGAALHDADKSGGAFYAGRRQVVEFFDLRKTDVHLRPVQPLAFGQKLR